MTTLKQTIEEAIKLAIEKGGYFGGKISEWSDVPGVIGIWTYPNAQNTVTGSFFNLDDISLDPLFWQALGRGLGETQKQEKKLRDDEELSGYHIIRQPWWEAIALQYFKLKLTNGNEQEFWTNILN